MSDILERLTRDLTHILPPTQETWRSLLTDSAATIEQLRAEVEVLMHERKQSGWFPPMSRVMQQYPGFDWSDYPDGLSDDDAEQFFTADLQECWALVEKETTRADKAEAERDAAIARAEKLEAALKPFAEHDDFHASDDWAVTQIDDGSPDLIPGVTAGDFKRAKAALASLTEGE